MQRTILISLLVLGLALGPTGAAAEAGILLPSFAAAEDIDPGEPFDLASLVDERHTELSDRVVDLGRRLDRFFGGEQYGRETKTSELRLGLTTRFTEDEIGFDTRVRFRLALPNTERRLSVILQSAEDDLFTPAAEEPPRFSRRPREDRDYFAGLRYVHRLADNAGIDIDGGVKLRLPPDPYFRVRGGRSWFLDLWEARLSQSLFWRRSEGQGATTELLLQRALPGPRFLQSVTQATWLDEEQRFFYSEDLILSHEFSELHAIQLRLGVRAESQPDTHLTSYFVNLPWRRNVYREWLFLEVRPELLFEQETDFDMQPRLFLVLEAYFGDHYVAKHIEPAAPPAEPPPRAPSGATLLGGLGPR